MADQGGAMAGWTTFRWLFVKSGIKGSDSFRLESRRARGYGQSWWCVMSWGVGSLIVSLF